MLILYSYTHATSYHQHHETKCGVLFIDDYLSSGGVEGMNRIKGGAKRIAPSTNRTNGWTMSVWNFSSFFLVSRCPCASDSLPWKSKLSHSRTCSVHHTKSINTLYSMPANATFSMWRHLDFEAVRIDSRKKNPKNKNPQNDVPANLHRRRNIYFYWLRVLEPPALVRLCIRYAEHKNRGAISWMVSSHQTHISVLHSIFGCDQRLLFVIIVDNKWISVDAHARRTTKANTI